MSAGLDKVLRAGKADRTRTGAVKHKDPASRRESSDP